VIPRPDYHGGSIVNLMGSLRSGLGGGTDGTYPPLRALAPERVAAARQVVLLVIDGLGHALLGARGRGGALHAHLSGPIDSVYPPTTATAVTTLLTGAAPQQHGLTGWFVFLREIGTVAAVLPFTPRWGRRPLSADGVDAAALLDLPDLFGDLEADTHVVLPASIADSDFSRAACGPARRHACASLAQLFDIVAALLRGGGRRRYVHAYWPELDRLQHEHGPGSAAVAGHLAAIDDAFAAFLERCNRDTLVIATADHGFVASPPAHRVHLDQHPELAAMLTLPLCGEPRTAWCYVDPDRAGAFEAYVSEHLGHCAELVPSARLVEDGVFGLGAPHPQLAARLGSHALIMRGDWVVRDAVPGEEPVAHAGVHGGASEEELQVPLCLAGP